MDSQPNQRQPNQRRPITQVELESMLDCVARVDIDVARALTDIGYPKTRQSSQGFESFVRAVSAQQVSVAAARAIFKKVQQGLGSSCQPSSILKHDEDSLREMGLSRPKARYILGMAWAAQAGDFRPADLPYMDDDTAISHITALNGFGQWSAEIYLLFSEGRADMFPAGDLAVQKGFQILKGLDFHPKEKALRGMTEHWRPWRGAMAIFLWHLYGSTTLG